MNSEPNPVQIEVIRHPGWRFLALWASTNALGFVAAIVTHHAITNYGAVSVGFEFLALLAGISTGIAVISVTQGLVLRRFAPHLHWRAWIWASLAGYLLGFVLLTICALWPIWTGWIRSGGVGFELYPGDLLLEYGLSAVALAFPAGAIAASVQALVLRKQVRNVAPWVFMSAIAWPIGLFNLLLAPGGTLQWDVFPRLLVISAIGGIVSGIISGIALVGLLRQTLILPATPTSPMP